MEVMRTRSTPALALRSTRLAALPALACAVAGSVALAAGPYVAAPAVQSTSGAMPQVPDSLVRPIPSTGAVPPIADRASLTVPRELAPGVSAIEYERRAKALKASCFGGRKGATRARGISQISDWTDPTSWPVLWRVMRNESDDVRLAVLDHFTTQGGLGEAQLADLAIRDEDPAIRHEAARRIRRPAGAEVLAVIDNALRAPQHTIANNAGILAGRVDAFAAIPVLIFAQATADEARTKADLAWIAIATRQSYVANVVPIVGNASGAFQPVIGSVATGVVMRVQDAVVYTYRADVHNALVSLTTRESGQSTADFGWDMARWWTWFNTEFVPAQRAKGGLPPADRTP
jgi:hypothetical protein